MSQNRRKTLIGEVVSDKMDKTVKVVIVRRVKHPLVKKYINRTTKILAHNENNMAKVGDTVKIKEVRPISKRKRWLVVEIIKKAGEQIQTTLENGSDNL
ncbi:MAG: 30S ribosomal protein S17 [Candidatus Goldbacteria bacterium]|nr:30S ribosomal protein S17 [Candidatus Goldiibacteriota bacterium]